MTLRPSSLGDLKQSGWKSRSVKEEMEANLIEALRGGAELFPGIVGYERSVLPGIENAILAGHDMIFLGERGQAKTRIIRALTGLLDEWIPVIKDCEINDDPMKPACRSCRLRLENEDDNLPIEWLHRSERYGEKLATPDVSIADLIGEIDPVKIAEGRYLADETAIHFGLVPRTNRGIFAINELPDLAEKVQVGLFNIMEERDVQIKGFKVRLDLDIVIVATANPEDYTSRGRIITPLKDRFASQVRTHYPTGPELEAQIVEQEWRRPSSEGPPVRVPEFMAEIIAAITIEARHSPEINQQSGVSVRMSIANYENMAANARRRAVRLEEPYAVPRISDLFAIYSSSRGKIELEYSGEDHDESEIIQLIIGRVVLDAFNRLLNVDKLKPVADVFDAGAVMEVSSLMPSTDYMDVFTEIPEMMEAAHRLRCDAGPPELASAAEFILEGLHLNRKLNKNDREIKQEYSGKHTGTTGQKHL